MLTTLLAIALSFPLDTPPDSASWPGFLGAGAGELDASTLPVEWSPETNIAWKAPIEGFGQSSPVVWKGRIFVTSVEGKMKETCRVSCFRLEDGDRLWAHTLPSSDEVESTDYVSRAAPTPAVDARGVYAFFESGDLVALSHEGEVLWSRSLAKDYGRFQNRFGLGASVAQTDDAIFVLADHEGPSYLLALRKKDGENLWKTARESRVSWSSPVVLEIGGKAQIVASSSGSVDGYDAKTGERLWTIDEVGGNSVATPLPFGEGRFLVGAAPGERGENVELASRSNIAVELVTEEAGITPKTLWTAKGALSSFASPIVYRGYAYWVNRAGAVFCFDKKTGEEKYAERLDESCWATPIGAGDRIYFFGRRGQTTVIAAGDTFKKLATNRLFPEESATAGVPPSGGAGDANRLAGPAVYGVAVAGGSFLVRTGSELYCLRLAEGARPAETPAR